MVAGRPDEGRDEARAVRAEPPPELAQTAAYVPCDDRSDRMELPVGHAEVIAPLPGEFSRSLQSVGKVGKGGMAIVYGARLRDPREQSTSELKAMIPRFVRAVLKGKFDQLSRAQRDELHGTLSRNIDSISDLVAVKVIDLLAEDGLESSAERRLRFLDREIGLTLLKSQKLPASARIYGAAEEDGKLLLCEEYIDGCNGAQLNRAWGEGRPFDIRALADLAALESLAILQAHEAGLIHRDIKPSNFMVARGGHVKLLDFGLAKQTDPRATQMTKSGAILGTVDYISPEQARGSTKRKVITNRADVYSFGIMLAERLTGEIPVRGRGGNIVKTLERRQAADEEGPPSLSVHRVRQLYTDERERIYIERHLLPLILSSINPDPLRRPSMEEMAEELHDYSSFSGIDFQSVWCQPEMYEQNALLLLLPEGEGAFDPRDPRAMVAAIVRGAKEQAKRYDFLADLDELEYQTGLDTSTYRGRGWRRPIVTRWRAATGAAVLAAIGGIGYWSTRDSNDHSPVPSHGAIADSSIPVVPPIGKDGNIPAEAARSLSERGLIFEEEGGMPTRVRLFQQNAVEIPQEVLRKLYVGEGEQKKVGGAAFYCSPERLCAVLGLPDVSALPSKLRNGRWGFYLKSAVEGNEDLVMIMDLGVIRQDSRGNERVFAAEPTFMAGRNGQPMLAHATANAKGELSFAFQDVTGVDPMPETWPPEWERVQVDRGVNVSLQGMRSTNEKERLRITLDQKKASSQ